jgi:hypothetical protein
VQILINLANFLETFAKISISKIEKKKPDSKLYEYKKEEQQKIKLIMMYLY